MQALTRNSLAGNLLPPRHVSRRSRAMRPRSIRAPALFDEDGETLTAVLTEGTETLPPLVEVSVKVGKKDVRVVKPPGVDELWQWYEMTGNMEADPSWGRLWETSKQLSRCIFDEVDFLDVRGKRVAEVGCGLGLVGLSAAMNDCASVIFCDREPLAIHCALSSAAVNNLQVVGVQDLQSAGPGTCCSGSLLDWADPQALGQPVDVVLGADCLYDPNTAALLARCCRELVAGEGTVVLSEPEKERALGCREAFLSAAAASGASRTEILSPPPGPQGEPPSVFIVATWT
jgi:predicted nicotinamide N-methyase